MPLCLAPTQRNCTISIDMYDVNKMSLIGPCSKEWGLVLRRCWQPEKTSTTSGKPRVFVVQGEMFTRPGILVDAFPSWAPEIRFRVDQDPLKGLKQMTQWRVEGIKYSWLKRSRYSFDQRLCLWTCQLVYKHPSNSLAETARAQCFMGWKVCGF